MKIVTRSGIRFIMADALSVPGVTHAFGTMDPDRTPPPAHARIRRAFPELSGIVTVKQVHGKDAVRVTNRADAEKLHRKRVEADIVIVSAPGVGAGVRTADCTPVLVLDPKRRVAAAIHAGWRGTAAGAPARAVEILVSEYGSRVEDLRAGIGPCILPCHYQVDEPVIAAMDGLLGGRAGEVLAADGPGKARLDLSTANRIILEQAGLLPQNIEQARLCTYCHRDLFFSYRRQGKGVPSLYHFIAVG